MTRSCNRIASAISTDRSKKHEHDVVDDSRGAEPGFARVGVHAFADGISNRLVDRAVREVAQHRRHRFERHLPGEIAKCSGKGEAKPLAAKRGLHVIFTPFERQPNRSFGALIRKGIEHLRQQRHRLTKERRMSLGPLDGLTPRFIDAAGTHVAC